MNETPLYQAVQSRRAEGGRTLACVLNGECAGEQLLLCEGVPVWQCGETELLRRNLPALQSCTATGVQEISGQRVFVERFGAVPQLVVCGGGGHGCSPSGKAAGSADAGNG